MQALILAAGFGKRLRPMTNDLPKALVKVNDIPILENTLNQLSKHPFDRIVIVLGYLGQVIIDRIGHEWNGIEIVYIDNEVFDETNNIYSVWLAREHLNQDTLLVECDIFFEDGVLQHILQHDDRNQIIVSKFQSGMDGTVVEMNQSGEVGKMYPSRDQGRDFDYSDKYKTVNIYWFKKDFLEEIFIPNLDVYVKTGDLNRYYEIVLTVLIYLQNTKIYPLDISDYKWAEVDSFEDLEHANNIFWSKRKLLDKVLKLKGGFWRYDFEDFTSQSNNYFPVDNILQDFKVNLPNLVINTPSSQPMIIERLSNWVQIESEYLVVGNGSTELLKFLTQVVKEIAISAPSTIEIDHIFEGSTVHQVKRDLPSFTINREGMLKTCRENPEINTVLLVGPYYSPSELDKLDFIKEFISELSEINHIDYIIIKESFVDLVSSRTTLPKELDNFPKLVILRSLGTDLGVSGIRLGYIASANIELITTIRSLSNDYSVNSFAERLLDLLPKYRREYEHSIQQSKSDRIYFIDRLEEEFDTIEVIEAFANYIYIKLPDGINSLDVRDLLFTDHNILVTDCSGDEWVENGNYIRVSTRKSEKIEYFISNFSEVLSKLTKD